MKAHNKIGEKVGIKTPQNYFEGIIISNENVGITLKLPSGYNVFVDKKTIKSLRVIQWKKEENKPAQKTKEFDFNLPTISILQIGGTIASRVDYETGAVKISFEPRDLLAMFPELQKIANFKSRLIGKIFSEDIRFAHYTKMAKAVMREISDGDVKGVIIPHGTDTMHYTAAALSFAFENLPVPVVLVGAQRSSDRGSSDAALNLLSAVQFIVKTDFKGVAICMHENTSDDTCLILPAAKTRKLHTSRRDAFRPVNANLVARVNPHDGKIEFIQKQESPQGGILKCLGKFEEKVAIIRCHPNMFAEQFDFYRKQKYKGLIIEGTGLGQAPVGVPDALAKPNAKNLMAIQKLVKSGCIVVMTSQCIFGSVQMHVYQNAVYLARAGVIAGHDMLTETAFVKLAWLLGNFSREKAKELMEKNLRGEINERQQLDFFPPKLQ